MKTPAFQFYPGDWRKDPELRSISLTARGLWIELLCLMHESSRKGFLVTKTGNSYSNEQLARMVGVDIQTLEICLTEIEASGVSSREEATGVLFSRRMVKDAEISQKRREAGELGGNPVLLKHKDNHQYKQTHKQKPTPSSSSSSSSSSSEELTPPSPSSEGEVEKKPPVLVNKKQQLNNEFEQIWEICWVKRGKGAARKAYFKARTRGVSFEEIRVAVIEQGPGILAEAQRNQSTPVYLATWLNQERQDDEPKFANSCPSRAAPPQAEEDWSVLDDEPERGTRKQHA